MRRYIVFFCLIVIKAIEIACLRKQINTQPSWLKKKLETMWFYKKFQSPKLFIFLLRITISTGIKMPLTITAQNHLLNYFQLNNWKFAEFALLLGGRNVHFIATKYRIPFLRAKDKCAISFRFQKISAKADGVSERNPTNHPKNRNWQ